MIKLDWTTSTIYVCMYALLHIQWYTTSDLSLYQSLQMMSFVIVPVNPVVILIFNNAN